MVRECVEGPAVSKSLAKLLIMLAITPVPALLAQSKDQPDQGFGPIDSSAPAMAPAQIIQQFSAKETEGANRSG
jgi:hypothetical protein